MPLHICHARKNDHTRCTFTASYFDNQLCGVHNNQRIRAGQMGGQPWVLPVWPAPAPAPAPEPAPAPAPEPAPAPAPACLNCARRLPATRVRLNMQYCGWCEQRRPRPDLPVEMRCCWKTLHPRGRVCMIVNRPGHTMCWKHAEKHRLFVIETDYTRASERMVIGPWQTVVEEIETNFVAWPNFGQINSDQRRTLLLRLARQFIIPELYNRISEQTGRQTRMVEGGNIFVIGYADRPRPPPRPIGLAAFALDRQNVHTRETSETTNKGLRILLEVPVADPANIYAVIVDTYARMPFANMIASMSRADMNVLHDVVKWYNTSLCHVPDDFLYKRTLDALWVRIQASEHKTELKKRLWEEWTESVGMCCDGHITRLVNVLVGFDPEFLPPVSAGELLQQRMATLAGLEIETEEKVLRANAIFDELGTPAEERTAWIEAF